jgi:hypothetical protein
VVACTTWQIIAGATTTRYPDNALLAVSAPSPTAAWAVGGTYARSATAPLIEGWSGTAWSSVASPGTTYLNGVAAVSSTDVWTVGGFGNVPGSPATFPEAVIQHWNGTQWSAIPAAKPSGSTTALEAVVALASNDVWAVGSLSAAGVSQPLIERWDGTAWKVVGSPALPGMTQSALHAVTGVPSTDQLWAVGSQLKTPRESFAQALIEQWDGTAWKVVAGPPLPSGAFASWLSGVVALSATDAWAVGTYDDSKAMTHPLIAHWNGAAWKLASAPTIWGVLSGVAAVGARDVRAVGLRYVTGGATNTMGIVERWDGTSWSVSDLPTPQGTGDIFPRAIAADGAGGYWAVGAYYYLAVSGGVSTSRALIERCS